MAETGGAFHSSKGTGNGGSRESSNARSGDQVKGSAEKILFFSGEEQVTHSSTLERLETKPSPSPLDKS